MKVIRALLKSLFLFSIFCINGIAQEMVVNTSSEIYTFEIDPTETFAAITEKVSLLIDNADHFLIEYPLTDSSDTINVWQVKSRKQGQYLGYPRNYFATITEQERSDIYFIVTTLANKGLVALATYTSALEDAGDRIDHIHPLRFLMTVFTDEEMKVGIRNIRTKGWVWKNFVGGLKDTLTVEAKNDNLNDEYIDDFAKEVGINQNSIKPMIQNNSWDQLIDFLIKNVPRKGNYDRYDC